MTDPDDKFSAISEKTRAEIGTIGVPPRQFKPPFFHNGVNQCIPSNLTKPDRDIFIPELRWSSFWTVSKRTAVTLEAWKPSTCYVGESLLRSPVEEDSFITGTWGC